MQHKLSFENRLIRFLIFDLMIGFELAELDWGMAEWIYSVVGGLGIYLLLTTIAGYCLFHSLFIKLKGLSEERVAV